MTEGEGEVVEKKSCSHTIESASDARIETKRAIEVVDSQWNWRRVGIASWNMAGKKAEM